MALKKWPQPGPMRLKTDSCALIEERFGVTYHWKYVPELLHKLGFSVQRPRKRLSQADQQAQEYWLRKRLPELKKKPAASEQ
jgi:transposase